jgi:hypothetical protein
VTAPRPNLFLIGSMKSGTTYLSGLLAAHPSVFMSSPKEPCRFVDPKVLRRQWPWPWEQGFCRSEARYLALFAAAGDARVIAEASTVYSQAPLYAQVPERILEFNPRARFIYIMRDPVERTISHYWHRVRGWGERRGMLEAIREHSHYREVSHYARQLQLYLRHVAGERIYTLTYEELLADPALQLSRLYAWLGIDPAFRPPRIGIPDNVLPPVVHQVRSPGLLDFVRRSGIFRPIAPLLPRALRRFAAAHIATRRVLPAEVDTAEVRALLGAECRRQTEELGRLLGREFPEWTSLQATPVATAVRGQIPPVHERSVRIARADS